MRLSDASTSGSFGDQTFSPALDSPAGEAASKSHFDASFSIGTTLATAQLGLHMSVSPDSGDGSRMSYLRFEDHAEGVHVFFDDVTNPGSPSNVPIRSGSRSTSRPARATTWSRSTSTER